jgi:hypothetical protein
MSCGQLTAASQRGKLLELAQGATGVPVGAVITCQGEISDHLRLGITDGCRSRSGLIGRCTVLAVIVVQHQVVGQPGQMPDPGNLANFA